MENGQDSGSMHFKNKCRYNHTSRGIYPKKCQVKFTHIFFWLSKGLSHKISPARYDMGQSISFGARDEDVSSIFFPTHQPTLELFGFLLGC